MGWTGEVETLTAEPIWFSESNPKMTLRSLRIMRSNSGIKIKSSSSDEVLIQEALCFKHWAASSRNQDLNENKLESRGIESPASDPVPDMYSETCLPELPCTGPMSELDDAALKLQKVYKSYRTRRNLADCAVVVEELWWKALDFASLRRCSISFFNGEKRESAVSRWARARTRAAKVGKGLSKNEKAQKLALQHWLEAIDPRHRYGHNLHFYYDVWFKSESTQPFFYWLDIGDGKETNLEKCPRNILQYQCVTYLGQNERKAYEVIFENGKLVHKLSKRPVSTVQGSKWIFVLSTSRAMYVGQKKKGKFQHSSFLAGGATTAAGRLVVKQGILKAVWPYSGHYLPTEENFKEFISFLQENNVDLSDVRTCSISNDERPSFKKLGGHSMNSRDDHTRIEAEEFCEDEMDKSPRASARSMFDMDNNVYKIIHESSDQAACKWTTGVGPRIGCVRDYPTDLQCKALEQVNLPPTDDISPTGSKGPIPSPRPGTGLRLSPMLTNMSFPAPTISLTIPKLKKR